MPIGLEQWRMHIGALEAQRYRYLSRASRKAARWGRVRVGRISGGCLVGIVLCVTLLCLATSFSVRLLLAGDVERNPGPLPDKLLSAVDNSELVADDLRAVYREVYTLAGRWRAMYLSLGLSPSERDAIAASYPNNPHDCLQEALLKWLQRAYNFQQYGLPTWRMLIEAVADPAGGNDPALAEKIAKAHQAAVVSPPTPNSTQTVDTPGHTTTPVQQQQLPDPEETHNLSHLVSRRDTSTEDCSHASSSGLVTDKGYHPTSKTGSTTEENQFPYLEKTALSREEKDTLKGRLQEESMKIMLKFQGLVDTLRKSLQRRNVPVEILASHLSSLGAFTAVRSQRPLLEDCLPQIRDAPTIDHAFWNLRHYFSFFNYHVIEHIIESLGTEDDKSNLQKYNEDMKQYCKRRCYECPSCLAKPSDVGKMLILKLDVSFEPYSVEQLQIFKCRLSQILQISEGVLKLCDIEKGCIQFTFQIPSFMEKEIFPLSHEQERALIDEGVLDLRCGEYVFSAEAWKSANSCTPLSMSQSSRRAAEGDTSTAAPHMATAASVEYLVLQKNTGAICDLVTHCAGPDWFADRIMAEDFITSQARNDIMGTSSECQKCSRLISAVLAQVKIDPDKYHTFLSILQENTALSGIISLLSRSLVLYTSEPKPTHPEGGDTDGTSHAIPASEFYCEFPQLITDLVTLLEKCSGALGNMKTALETRVFLECKHKFVCVVQSKAYRRTKTVRELFSLLAPCWSATDYSILCTLVRASGCKEAKERLDAFLVWVKSISSHVVVHQNENTEESAIEHSSAVVPRSPLRESPSSPEPSEYTQAIPMQPQHSHVEVEAKFDVNTLTLSQYESSTSLLCGVLRLPRWALSYFSSGKGCISIRWKLQRDLLPYVLSHRPCELHIQLLAQQKIISIRVGSSYQLHVPTLTYWKNPVQLLETSGRGSLGEVNFLLKTGVEVDTRDKDGWTALMLACRNDHLETVKALVKAGAALDIQNKHGITALMVACRNGHLETVKALVEAGAALDIQMEIGWTALMLACRNGHLETVKALAKAGAALDIQEERGWTALMLASQNGHLETVKALAKAGAALDIQEEHGVTALMFACSNGHLETAKALAEAGAALDIQMENGSTILMWASVSGHLETVKTLVEAGAALDIQTENGLTALMLACIYGNLETVKTLVEAGAVLDIQNKIGWTALIVATVNGHLETVKALVKAGAALDIQNKDGWTALMEASLYGHLKTVKALVEAGVALDIQMENGGTALMVACSGGHLETVNALVEAGAALDIQEENGLTALMLACSGGHLETVNALVKAGAALDIQMEHGLSALMMAARQGHTSVVIELLRAGAKTDIQDMDGFTALMLSAQNAHTAVLQQLLHYKAKLDIQETTTGWTAIFFAAKDGNVEIVRLLLQSGCNPNIKDNNNITALDVARTFAREEVCEELRKYMASHHEQTPLNEAVKEQVLKSKQWFGTLSGKLEERSQHIINPANVPSLHSIL